MGRAVLPLKAPRKILAALPASGGSGGSWVCGSTSPVSSFVFRQPSPLCIHLSLELGPTWIQADYISESLIIPAKIYFQVRSHSEVPGVGTWTGLSFFFFHVRKVMCRCRNKVWREAHIAQQCEHPVIMLMNYKRIWTCLFNPLQSTPDQYLIAVNERIAVSDARGMMCGKPAAWKQLWSHFI